VIRNRYLTQQYVFVDEQLVGSVPVGEQAEFQVTAGSHVVTISDRKEQKHNVQSVAEVYDPQMRYTYEVVPR
jgi:hypothetical protein